MKKNHIFTRKPLAVLCFIFIFSIPVLPKTPAEYRENVLTAKELVFDLLYTDPADYSLADYQSFERETIGKIRAALPGSETVEWEGTVIETANQWLADKLNAYEKEPLDSEKRKMILNGISERLEALDQKLAELENPPVSSRTKDEDKQKLAEILKREEYQKPEQQEESWIQSIIRRIGEWLKKLLPQPEIRESPAGYQSFSVVLVIIVLAAVLVITGFLFYKFAPLFAGRRRRDKREKRERVILGERITADENAGSLFSEAERLAREGNLRQAIRKGYIALLCELSDKKIIGLAQHKTNRDYLRDVRRRRELYQNMSGLTDNFERHWYGFDEANEEDWEEFRSGYKKVVSL